MRFNFRKLLAELGIIAICSIGVWLLLGYGPGNNIVNRFSLDIGLNDTYFVFNGRTLIPVFILMLLTLIYITREAWYGYRRYIPNIIWLVINFVLVTVLLAMVPFLFGVTNLIHAWAAIPLIPGRSPHSADVNTLSRLITLRNWLYLSELFFLGTLVAAAILTGRSSKQTSVTDK